MDWTYWFNLALLLLGFGFVIFWHELGHFLAAKWAGVRVDQFAVGFGQALLAYRKGIGVRVGSTQKEYLDRAQAHILATEGGLKATHEVAEAASEQKLVAAADQLGLGETEYRLNWMPLGGYVKMVGQDDMDATATSSDPRSYERKSIGARMIIVSAGVVMNVLLAAVLFAILFRVGFNAPPAQVGSTVPGSPAQLAGLRVGDVIETLDGTRQHDFNKIVLNAALVKPGADATLVVRHLDGKTESLKIQPKTGGRLVNLLGLGFEPPRQLQAIDRKTAGQLSDDDKQLFMPESFAVSAGETIVAANGTPLLVNDFAKLDEIVQSSGGEPIELTIAGGDGTRRTTLLTPRFADRFARQPLGWLGMEPRVRIESIQPKSPAKGQILPGDVIAAVASADALEAYSVSTLRHTLQQAGKNNVGVALIVERAGKDGPQRVELPPIVPSMALEDGNRGLGVSLMSDEATTIVGGILEGSPAARAGVPVGSVVTAVNGQPVQSWHDVLGALRRLDTKAEVVDLRVRVGGGEHSYKLTVAADELATATSNRYELPLMPGMFKPLTVARKTDNVLTAAGWGAMETRDMVLQFYLTIRRIIGGSVAASNLSGPIGIVQTGSLFATRGTDWLIWFLAMISANLAVVNFLPIPIVDGGLFTFLLIEKLTGRPPSARVKGIAQVVGLGLIVSLFLFVTYHDIMRIVG